MKGGGCDGDVFTRKHGKYSSFFFCFSCGRLVGLARDRTSAANVLRGGWTVAEVLCSRLYALRASVGVYGLDYYCPCSPTKKKERRRG